MIFASSKRRNLIDSLHDELTPMGFFCLPFVRPALTLPESLVEPILRQKTHCRPEHVVDSRQMQFLLLGLFQFILETKKIHIWT